MATNGKEAARRANQKIINRGEGKGSRILGARTHKIEAKTNARHERCRYFPASGRPPRGRTALYDGHFIEDR